MEGPSPKLPKPGKPDNVAGMDWKAVEASVKSGEYATPAEVASTLAKRDCTESDIDAIIGSGYLHEIIKHEERFNSWTIRWFGWDKDGRGRYCAFTYFKDRQGGPKWQLNGVQNVRK